MNIFIINESALFLCSLFQNTSDNSKNKKPNNVPDQTSVLFSYSPKTNEASLEGQGKPKIYIVYKI